MGHGEVRAAAAGRRRIVHGVSLGILILDTRFTRFPGDIGNGATWDFPVQYQLVEGASPERVVTLGAKGLLPAFIEAGRKLVEFGVDGITTTCGFLSQFQEELAEALPVPVATSSLLQVPLVERLLPKDKRVGVLTYDKGSLTPRHLSAVGVAEDTPVEGIEKEGAMYRAIMGPDTSIPQSAWEADILAAGERLVARHPEIGAIVAECTNMPPFSAALSARLGTPVYDMGGLVTWFRSGLRPRTW